MRPLPLALFGAALAAAAVLAPPLRAQFSVRCDRACLVGLADRYLAAMVAHDPSRAPVTRSVRYTENTSTMPLGEGLWVGASSAPTFKIYVPDPLSGQLGFFGVMKEFDKPVLLAMRLRVEGGSIAEVEHVVARDLRPNGLANLQTPRRAFSADVPPGERSPRDEMIRIASSYYDSIERSDGSVAPFADDCERHENGMQTTGVRTPRETPVGGAAAGASSEAMAKIGALGCKAGIDSHLLSYITKIGSRRLLAVDPEKGLVFGLSMFHHKGNVRTIKIVGVPGVDTIPMNFGPIDLEGAHIFKIRGGRIHEIEAMGFLLPYDSKSGWE